MAYLGAGMYQEREGGGLSVGGRGWSGLKSLLLWSGLENIRFAILTLKIIRSPTSMSTTKTMAP